MEKFEQLEKLGKLKEQGLLNEAEFETEKILNSNTSSEPNFTIPPKPSIPEIKTFQVNTPKAISIFKKKPTAKVLAGGGAMAVLAFVGISFFTGKSDADQKAEVAAIVERTVQNQEELRAQQEADRLKEIERKRQEAHDQAENYLKTNILGIKGYLESSVASEVRRKYPNLKFDGLDEVSAKMNTRAKIPRLEAIYTARLTKVNIFANDHYKVSVNARSTVDFTADDPNYNVKHVIQIQN